jgi:GNAT superfamily N-acetyltransferase
VDAAALGRWREGLRGFQRLLTRASPDAGLVEADGVVASVVPAVPERSLPNSVSYDDPRALAAALGRLEAAYADAGVDAWTVWVPEPDREVARGLARRGHVLDAQPLAMEMDLDDARRPVLELDWSAEADAATVARINDASYPFAEQPFSRMLRSLAGARAYVARVDGRPVSCCVVTDLPSGVAHLSCVATLPDARGRGIAGALVAHALCDARERGMRRSTLEATRAGAPVYSRLGYRTLCAIGMWERRARPADGPRAAG